MRDLRASDIGFIYCPERGHCDPYTLRTITPLIPFRPREGKAVGPSCQTAPQLLKVWGCYVCRCVRGEVPENSTVTFRLQCKKHRHGMVLRMSFGWPRTPFGQIMMRIPYEMRRRDAGGAVRDRAAAPAAISLEVRHLWEGVDTYWE